MKERDKAVVVGKVNAFLTKIKDLSTIDKTLASKIRLSLKETTNYIEKDMCAFDSTLGDVLDLIVNYFNKNGITNTTDNFCNLVGKHIKNITNVDNKDESFMSIKKLLSHVKRFNDSIPKSKLKLEDLFEDLKKSEDENEVKEISKKILKEALHEYLEIIIDLLKLEKYRLTDKLTVKDTDLIYCHDRPIPVGTTAPIWELIIKDITSKDFIPKESDIIQGDISDCYLLAALKNIVRSDPNMIKKCFVANKEDGIVVRFYKVLVTFTRDAEDATKIMLESKAAGRVMIKMDKTLLLDISKGMLFGNKLNYISSIWVNLIEKAYAIYVSKNNIIGRNFNFQEFVGLRTSVAQKSNLAAVEGGVAAIATTAITGKKGIGFFPYITQQQPSSITSGNVPGNSTSQSQPTEKQIKSPINPSTIVGIIKKEIAEGKAMSASSYLPDNPCWKTPLSYDSQYINPNDFVADHVYSIKGIEKVGNTDYIVLSNPHMSHNGFMITGNKITTYGNTGDVYLTNENFYKYFAVYYINKLKKGKRG